MGQLLQNATTKNALRLAWYRIRANGSQSSLPETREAVKDFEREAERNIGRIQNAIREKKFEFQPQKGVLKAKSSGGYRGIVMAPIANRIVERAWLDCLQEKVDFVKQVIETPTSVGGVPDRSVPHGLALIRNAFSAGKNHFVRADISGFFDGISRDKVLKTLSGYINDELFLEVLKNATTVTLENEKILGENRKVFPTDNEGVAQGSPLSPLFGNILLHDFDKNFNEKGIVCVRFIDDFVMLGEKETHVRKAFENARKYLAEDLGLKCHDPFDAKTSREKAQHGNASEGNGFIFLGYDIRPGLFQPSKSARTNLLQNIDRHLKRGRKAIVDAVNNKNSSQNRQCYVQTQQVVDSVIRGWGNAFSYGNAPATLNDLDELINVKLEQFRQWFGHYMQDKDQKSRRRAGGVCLLEDIQAKSLDELPFRFEKKGHHRNTKNTIAISTDGSLIPESPFKKDKGTGGWAAVFHDGKEISGSQGNTTNNRMELTAVIEALKCTTEGSRVKVRTDSQYVFRVAEKGEMISKNMDLWKEFESLREKRKVEIVWIKGHAGDPHNERADQLANDAAKLVQQVLVA